MIVPVALATFSCMFGIINLYFYRSYAYYCIVILIQSEKVNKLVFKTQILNLKRSRD